MNKKMTLEKFQETMMREFGGAAINASTAEAVKRRAYELLGIDELDDVIIDVSWGASGSLTVDIEVPETSKLKPYLMQFGATPVSRRFA